jgi:hypothetical protein
MAQWNAPSLLLPLIPRPSFAVLSVADGTRSDKFSRTKFVR